ncbi:MAG TPA: L-histidine N(alpha)-methyltransferase [Fimbriimonadales bacterium]|nr:L-histidine N(alpha)-methyltransferase [Fimbriimonadales bacterium]
MPNRLEWINTLGKESGLSIASAVREGLSASRKWLPPWLLYDAFGCECFEAITRLPEYYLTRSETEILSRHTGDIVAAAGENICLVEFGGGSGKKTRLLIEETLTRQNELHYVSIDIAAFDLLDASQKLLDDYPSLRITAIAGEYNDSITRIPSHPGARLFLFMGSNIGNLENSQAISFLSSVRRIAETQDRLLVGFDMVKEKAALEAAYNDSQGITAAFNKNLLVRINRELEGDFEIEKFSHIAIYNEKQHRIEMRLVSECEQTARIKKLNMSVPFEKGEYIHTENSYKYTCESFRAIAESSGFEMHKIWFDEREWFAVAMLEPK